MTKKMAAGVALLAVVLLFWYFVYPHLSISWLDAVPASPTTSVSSRQASAQLPLPTINQPGKGKTWVCPMHPEIMQDHPGTCPICGMDLVESKNHAAHDHGIQVDVATVQKLGVRLARVKKSSVNREIRSYGNVTADGNSVYNIYSKFDGSIKKIYIHSIGQKIEKGQVIYEIYSPQLIMQQKEFIQFIDRRNQIMANVDDARFKEDDYVMNLLQDFARQRSRFLFDGISFDTVQKIEDSRQPLEVVKVVAEESGIVTQINVREGGNVMPSAALFTLVNVAKVWVDIALYPDQAGQVKQGDTVTVKSSDGQLINARLDFISPIAESNKVSARVELDNSKLHLRPGSFVDVIIHAQPHDALVLPRSAVMRSGEGDTVMLSRGEGHFLPVHVETEVESGDEVEIVDGLLEGAEVAVNGQFLLDAAASLNSAAQRMQESHTHQ